MGRIKVTYAETLPALGGALDLWDPATAGYCLELAETLPCSDEQLKQIACGSYLQDIWEIGIPDGTLFKESN